MSEEAVKAAEAAEENTEATPPAAVAEDAAAYEAPQNDPAPSAELTENTTEGEASVTLAEPAAINADTNSPEAPSAEQEDVHYQAVEKEGTVTAIWEMQGQKHLRTIDPRSVEGKQILALFETAA